MSVSGCELNTGRAGEPRPRLLDLPDGRQTIIDAADVNLVSGYTWYVGNHGYATASSWQDGQHTMILLHRLLMQPPPRVHVDHINGDKLDNRRGNLRVVSCQRNQVNRKKLNRNNVSGVRGVAHTSLSVSRPWRAQITENGRNHHLGMFATRDEAVAARREAELLYFGELCP